MSEHGEEGQTPEEPTPEAGSGLPPRPTVRESLRRGLFVRLPTEADSHEGVTGPAEPEQVEQYEGWRQTPDGGWEPVDPEAYAYAEGYEPAPAETYPEIDQSANFASVAGGEPFFQPAEEQDNAWTFTGDPNAVPAPPPPDLGEYREAPADQPPAVEPEAAVPEAVAPEEIAPEVAVPEAIAPEVAVPEAIAPEAIAPEVAVPEPTAPEAAAPEVAAPEAEPVAVEQAPVVEAEVATEPAAPEAQAAAAVLEDPIAASGVFIPSDVELLETDMPVYGEKDKVAPIFKGEGLGEPLFIEFADLPKTLQGLRRLLPAKTRLTYNYDYERAWVRAAAEIDLPSFVERVNALAAEDEAPSE